MKTLEKSGVFFILDNHPAFIVIKKNYKKSIVNNIAQWYYKFVSWYVIKENY